MNTVKTKLLKNDPSLKQSQQITIEVDLNHYSELDDRRLDLLQDKFKWWKHWTMTDSELWFLDHCQSAFIYALKHRYIQSYSWKEGFDYTPNDSDDPRAEAQKEAYQDWLNETMNSQFYMDVGWSDEYDEPSSEPIVTVDISDHPDRERLLKWPKEAKYF